MILHNIVWRKRISYVQAAVQHLGKPKNIFFDNWLHDNGNIKGEFNDCQLTWSDFMISTTLFLASLNVADVESCRKL